MSQTTNTGIAIELDKEYYRLLAEATSIAGTASNPYTCAETHVQEIADRFVAQAEFARHLADGFWKLEE